MNQISPPFSLLLFLLALFYYAFSPGFAVISLLKIKLFVQEKFILSLGLGIAISCSLVFLTSLVEVGIIAGLFQLFFFSFFLRFLILSFFSRNIFSLFILALRKSLLPVIIISLGTFWQSSLISGGGFDNSTQTVSFSQTGDAMWIVSLSRELSKNIPPVHPGFAPQIVTNYHYFTHLFLGLIYNFTQIPLLNLYYNYFSVFLSFFLGASAYIYGCRKFKNSFSPLLLVIMTYGAGSFSYFLPIWLGNDFNWNDASFWVSQTFNIILNPPVMLSLSLLFLILLLLEIYEKEKVRRILLLLIVLSGTMISFKVYAGLLISGGILMIAFYHALKRDYLFFLVFFSELIISLLLFLPVSGKDSSGFLVLAPFWFLHTMVENPDRLNLSIWALKEQYYWATGNLFAVIRLRVTELIIFIVGNLGIRIVSFFAFPYFFFKKKPISENILFLIVIFLGGIILPLIFIQNGSVANTIQFFYYSLIVGNILTIFILEQLIPSKKLFLLFALTLIILSLPTTIRTYLNKSSKVILDKEESLSLLALKKLTYKNEIIFLPATSKNLSSMYVSAVADRNTFYSHRLMAENTLKDYQNREAEINTFFSFKNPQQGVTFQKNFLSKNELRTLYLLNEDKNKLINIYLPYKIAFQNKKAMILQFL